MFRISLLIGACQENEEVFGAWRHILFYTSELSLHFCYIYLRDQEKWLQLTEIEELTLFLP